MSEQANIPGTADTQRPSANEVVHAIHQCLWGDWDLRAAWPLIDPELRMHWVRWWQSRLGRRARAMGDRDAVAAAMMPDEPRHRWWAAFEAAALDLVAGLGPDDGALWGVSAEPYLMGPDLELLALWPVPDDPTAPVPVGSPNVPMLMRFEPAVGWRLFNFMGVDPPEPGWPAAR